MKSTKWRTYWCCQSLLEWIKNILSLLYTRAVTVPQILDVSPNSGESLFSPEISPEFPESLHQISENHAKSPKFARFPPQIIEICPVIFALHRLNDEYIKFIVNYYRAYILSLVKILENHALWKQRVPEFFQNKCISARILPEFRCKFHPAGNSDWTLAY